MRPRARPLRHAVPANDRAGLEADLVRDLALEVLQVKAADERPRPPPAGPDVIAPAPARLQPPSRAAPASPAPRVTVTVTRSIGIARTTRTTRIHRLHPPPSWFRARPAPAGLV